MFQNSQCGALFDINVFRWAPTPETPCPWTLASLMLMLVSLMGPADKQPRNLAWINLAKAKNKINGPLLKGVLLIYLYVTVGWNWRTSSNSLICLHAQISRVLCQMILLLHDHHFWCIRKESGDVFAVFAQTLIGVSKSLPHLEGGNWDIQPHAS